MSQREGGWQKVPNLLLKIPHSGDMLNLPFPPPTKLLTLEHFSYIKVTKIDHEEGLEIIGHSN